MNKEKTIRKLKETGITLVALVTTIIILLILVGVTLNLALGEGGIFARAKNTVDRYQSAQANELDQLTQLEEMLNNYGQGESTTGGGAETGNTTTGGDETGEEGEKASDLKDKLAGDTSVVGKRVTGLTGGVANQYTWEIFYVDENNIYLISTDYIKIADCPQKESVALTTGTTDYRGHWADTLIAKYTGSESINDIGKKLNSDYFSESKNYSSINANIKAVAYMLDTEIWKEKIVGTENSKVDYVVGGPSVELLFKAYNAKKGTNYRAKASSVTGYQISKDGNSWSTDISSMLDTGESTFVITSESKASHYWLSSPSAETPYYIMSVSYDGRVRADDNSSIAVGWEGFRPVVCLSSSVKLTEQDGGYAIAE